MLAFQPFAEIQMPSEPPTPGPYKRDVEALPEKSVGQKILAWLRQAPVTKAIIIINILVFIAMAVASNGEAVSSASTKLAVDWGADRGPDTREGDYWRLLTNLFVHFDLLHIASNMYVLSFVGQTAETLFGSSRFLFLYFASGIAGSITSLIMHPAGVSGGASGAVLGAFGAVLAIYYRHRDKFDPAALKSAIRSIILLVIINIAWGLKHPYIDNAAHVGGLVGGLLSGLCCMPPNLPAKGWSRRNVICSFLFVCALAAIFYLDVLAFDVPPR